MKLFTTTAIISETVSNINAGDATSFYAPVDIARQWAEAEGVTLDDKRARYEAPEGFDIEGVCTSVAVAHVCVSRSMEGESSAWVEHLFAAILSGGRYYRIMRTKEGRHGFAVVGATRDPQGTTVESERPKFFTKPSAKAVTAWVKWCDEREAAAVAAVEHVRAEREDYRRRIEASGLEFVRTIDGYAVYNGPVTVRVSFREHGVEVRPELRDGFYSEVSRNLDSFLNMRVSDAREVRQVAEAPEQKPTDGNAVRKVFNALTTEEREGAQVWTAEAVGIMQRVATAGSGIVTDICSRAMRGAARTLTDRQRWCVAYAFARL